MTDDRQTNTSLLEFPCVFPIKAIGRGHDLADIVAELVRRHVPDLTRQAVQVRPSKQGNYVAVTVTITATSQAQLDAVYFELTACDQIMMAL